MDIIQITGIVAVLLVLVIVVQAFVISFLKKKINIINSEAIANADAQAAKYEKEKALIKENADIARKSHKIEMDALIAKHEKELAAIKLECEEKIRLTREAIDSRRAVLSNKSEKELIIDTIVALDGQNEKLSRLEDALNTEKFRIELDRINQSISIKLEELIESINDKVDELCVKLNDSDVFSAVSELDESINEIKEQYSNLDTNICEIKEKYGDFDGGIDEIKNLYCNFENAVNSLENDVESIKNSVCDKYEYDSLASGVSEINSDIKIILETSEDAKEAAERAKDILEQLQYNMS